MANDHFTQIERGAVKSQKPDKCRECGSEIDKTSDYFVLDAHWKIKPKPDEIKFCGLECLQDWASEEEEEKEDEESDE